MDSNLQSLSKIFTEQLFRIPDYQRGYAWGEIQYNDFYVDLENLEDEKSHYVGVLTIETASEEKYSKWEDDEWIIRRKAFKPFYVVDGQQRLTTSIILIQAIVKTLEDKSIASLNDTSIEEIKSKFLIQISPNRIAKSYLFGYEKDNPSYEFLKEKILGEARTTNEIQQETIYTNNLESAYKFFLNKLKCKSESELDALYYKISQKFLFNIYRMESDIDVYIAFETMNNRGKALSYLELLKNRLIYLSTKIGNHDEENTTLRKNINECWKTIYYELGKSKTTLLDDDTFLLHHFIIYFSNVKIHQQGGIFRLPIRKKRIDYQNYLLSNFFTLSNASINKDDLNITTINKYVSSLKISVETWVNIKLPESSKFLPEEIMLLGRINRLDSESILSPLIMVIFLTEKNEFIRKDFLQALIIDFINNEIGEHSSIIAKSLYTDYAQNLFCQKKSITEIIKSLKNKTQKSSLSFETISQQFHKKNGFYNWSLLKFFLYEYEFYLQQQSKNNFVKHSLTWESIILEPIWVSYDRMPPTTSIEHIYPQTEKEEWKKNYDSYNTTEKRKLLNLIGNLVLLSQPKNSKLSNRSFSEKKNGVSGSYVGYAYGSYSEIEVAQNENWNPIDILNRTIKILLFIITNYTNLKIDKAEIVTHLGLDFILITENIRLDELS